MSSITQATPRQAAATEDTFRAPSRARARASIVDEAARLKAVYEEAIKELQASLAKAQEENTVLKQEVVQEQTRAQQSAAASQAAIDSLEATVETGKQTIEDLRREIVTLKAKCDEDDIKFARLHDVVGQLRHMCRWTPPLPDGILNYTLYGKYLV